MVTVSEWVDPIWDLKMLYFFIIKQGFSEQHKHSSAFSFLPFPIQTSWLLVEIVECVRVHVLQSVFVCVAVCFVNVRPLFFLLFFLYLSNPLPPLKEKLEPQHLNKLIRPSKLLLSVRLKTTTKKNISSQSHVMLFVALVTLESNSSTIFRHSAHVWVEHTQRVIPLKLSAINI